MNEIKRKKCLTPAQLSYLLIASSVVSGCTSKIDKSPEFTETYKYCVENKDLCKEMDEANKVVDSKSASFEQSNKNLHASQSSTGSFWNYYLMYHLFFSRNNNFQSSQISRFTNYDKEKHNYAGHRGTGVYSPGFVSRFGNQISKGDTAYFNNNGKVFKSSKFAGSYNYSNTGKGISRGSFGSVGRGFSVSS